MLRKHKLYGCAFFTTDRFLYEWPCILSEVLSLVLERIVPALAHAHGKLQTCIHLLVICVPLILFYHFKNQVVLHMGLQELIRVLIVLIFLLKFECKFRKEHLVFGYFLACVDDVCLRIFEVLQNVLLLFLVIQLDPSWSIFAICHVLVKLDQEFHKEWVILLDFPAEDVSDVVHHLLADLARLFEVLVQVDQLHHFLDLLVEARLHHVCVFDEVVMLEKVVHLLYGQYLRMLSYVFFEFQTVLLCPIKEMLANVNACLHLTLEHFLKEGAPFFAHGCVKCKPENGWHLIQFLYEIVSFQGLIVVFVRNRPIQRVEHHKILRVF